MIKPFEFWISLKYLFSKTKDRFLSIITIFSFFGIAIGVATLIIVMSVMNGFRDELTSKILGINGHMKIEKTGPISNKELQKVKKTINKENLDLSIDEVLTTQSLMSFRGFSNSYWEKIERKTFYQKR